MSWRFATAMAFVWLCLAAVPLSAQPAGEPDAAGIEFFESSIRPLLAARCYKCHSADANPIEGGLRLDTREGWMQGGDSGPALVPGEPGSSRLVTAVRYEDESLQMPPDGELPEREVAALVEWVRRGAPDPRVATAAGAAERVIDIEQGRQHWAFQPLVRVPPKVTGSSWCRTPIDDFILSALESKRLTPNPPVERRMLIRRASFDLIGLPPTPAEVDQFVNDPAPNAYELLVERLLSNPHYGQRWGRHWLDVVRFAESHGFEQDYDRPNAYHYRDFVIKALNADLPYDTFLRWQIAGDEFEPENPQALMATGFLAAGVHATQITANQAEKERYDELDDMVRTIGTTMLGLTIGCARCHDHKFDPIPTSDYYRLISTFSTTVRSDMNVNIDPAGHQQALARFQVEHAPLVAAVEAFERDELPGRFDAWLKSRPAGSEFTWVVLDPVEAKSEGGATFTRLDDGSLRAAGANPDQDTYTLTAETHRTGITALRIEALSDLSLAKGGPGRAENGNFALSNVRVTAAPLDGSTEPVELKLASARSTFDQAGLPVTHVIDGDAQSCWAIDPEFGQDHAAVFELEGPAGFEPGTRLTFTLEFKNNKQHTIGRPRLSVTTVPQPVPLDGTWIPEPLLLSLAALATNPAAVLAGDDRSRVLNWFRTLDPDWQRLQQAVEEHARQTPPPPTVSALVSSEGVPAVRLNTQGLDFYDPTYFLKRGDLNQKQQVAAPGFLQVLMRVPEQEKYWQTSPPEGWHTSYRRLALANWLTDVDRGAGHLAARVIVNRLWQHHVGRGLVGTPSDFGAQGDPPTHPALLDWLARELIEHGWRLKHIHKLIMTSSVYMQSGEIDEARLAVDRDNRLLWHRAARRLEAESIRDAMLAAGGALDSTMFGPGTLDPGHQRRSIYFFIKRSQLVPMMVLFDAPDSLQDIAQRPTTTIAPQALLLMNSEAVRGFARRFAERIDPGAEGPLEEAVDSAYRIALSRPPREDELADTLAFLHQQIASYQAARATAPAQPGPRELALADFCQVLFGLNEFVYVE